MFFPVVSRLHVDYMPFSDYTHMMEFCILAKWDRLVQMWLLISADNWIK